MDGCLVEIDVMPALTNELTQAVDEILAGLVPLLGGNMVMGVVGVQPLHPVALVELLQSRLADPLVSFPLNYGHSPNQ